MFASPYSLFRFFKGWMFYGLYVAVLTTDVPFCVISLTWYAVPALRVPVGPKFKVIVADELFAIGPAGLTAILVVASAPLMKALLMVAGVLPELVTMTCNVSCPPVGPVTNAMLVTETCSALPMNPIVIPPIHAATTTLTATVTAMRMIEAMTGLRAFEFFLIFLRYVFIFLFLPMLLVIGSCQKASFKYYVLLYNSIDM